MKAQATVEYLLLFSIGLVLISFAIGALAVIKDAEGQLTSQKQAEIAVSSFKSAADSACALGLGNSRFVDLDWGIELECENNVVAATVNGQRALAALEHCAIAHCDSEGTDFVVVNENGGIVIEEKN